ncbi:MAG: nicotinate-nucleotide--dimethylbenzimidazole phosphoribosyltransferase [Oscillospiraceae bacterium]|nr:nicotinate-nucleotide--dimethylbenzimidazole phosphoribosyltransferase [Oscillospiraceae bacterium]
MITEETCPYSETLDHICASIKPVSEDAAGECREKWSSIAIPLGSLGLLQEAVARICAITDFVSPSIAKRCVVVFCGDNGVVAEGVTQTGSEVTAIVAKNLCTGDTSVCKMSAVANTDVIPVDMGMNAPIDDDRILPRRLGSGTSNMAKEPAMTRETALRGIFAGIELARELKARGYRLFATGEMGIGNTTTSSAMASVLLNQPVERMTGVGAGLSNEGLRHKIAAIRTAISIHSPDPRDPIGVLAAVGGFDIAGMVGLYLGGALCRIPVVIDGFISSVAALCAARICPDTLGYMLASHCSGEPAGQLLLDSLGLHPMLTAGMRLGEGTGAVAAIPLLDMAFAVYNAMATFEEINVEAYQPL